MTDDIVLRIARAVAEFDRSHYRCASKIKLGYEEYKELRAAMPAGWWSWGVKYETFNGIAVEEVKLPNHLSIE